MPAEKPWYSRWVPWAHLIWLALIVSNLFLVLRQPLPAPAPRDRAPAAVAQIPPGPDGKARRLPFLESAAFDESLPAGAVARFGTIRFRAAGLPSMAFAPDGKSLWTSSAYGSIERWDIATGRRTTGAGPWLMDQGAYKPLSGLGMLCQQRPLLACRDDANRILVWNLNDQEEIVRCAGDAEPVQAAAFAPTGDLLAACAKDGAVRLWELPSGRLRHCWHLLHEEESPPALAIAPDGQTVAAVFFYWAKSEQQQKSIYCWNAVTGELLFSCAREQDHHGWDAVTFVNSHLLVTASMGRELSWWQAPAGKLLQTDALAENWSNSQYRVDLVANRAGDVLTTGGMDGYVRLWDAKERKLKHKFGGRGDIAHLAYSADEKTLATANMEGAIRLWDVQSGRELAPREGHLGTIKQLIFAPDGKKLVSAALDNTIRVWDVAAVKELQVLDGHRTAVDSLAVCGTTLLTCSYDAWCTWDLATGKLQDRRPQEEGYIHFALLPDRRTLAKACYGAGELSIQEGIEGQVLRVLPAVTEEDSRPVVSADGRYLAWSQSLWRPYTGRQLYTFKFEPLPTAPGQDDRKRHLLHAVAFAPNSRLVATGGADGALRLWEAATGKELAHWRSGDYAVYAVAFSPDGRWLACTAEATTLQLRDAATGRVVTTFQMSRGGSESHLAFSPDSRYLASACNDRNILLWDVEQATHSYRRPQIEFAQDELMLLWQNLADADGKVAYAAMTRLAAAAPAVTPFLEARLWELD